MVVGGGGEVYQQYQYIKFDSNSRYNAAADADSHIQRIVLATEETTVTQ